jgi:uncharacterized membrane protein (Fun14 family)
MKKSGYTSVKDVEEFSHEVSLTAAEILALNGTAKTLVPAPGAGKILEFISAQMSYRYGTVVYTIGGATNLQVQYTNIAGLVLSTTQAVTGMLDQNTNQVRTLSKLATSITPIVNAALVLFLDGANVTLGDGLMFVRLAYRVHNTGL